MAEQEMLHEEPKVYCNYSEMVPIHKVVPNPDNPNVHPDSQLQIMAGILRANGWRAPLVVSKRSGFVVKGHGRLLTARYIRCTVVPVKFQDYQDEQAELRDLIADNSAARESYVDAFGLGKLLKKVAPESQKDLGYSQEELGMFMAAEYVAPVQTDRQFVVLKTLKITKESKAVITRAVQKYCLLAGKEMDWGEALADICVQWEGRQGPMPLPVQAQAVPTPVPVPVQQPAPTQFQAPKPPDAVPAPKRRKKADDGSILSAANLLSGDIRAVAFTVKYVATTNHKGKELSLVRSKELQDRMYLEDPALIAKCKELEDKKVMAQYKVIDNDMWLVDVKEA